MGIYKKPLFSLVFTSFSTEIESRSVPYVRTRTYERELEFFEQKLFRIQNFIKNCRCTSYISEKLRSGHAYFGADLKPPRTAQPPTLQPPGPYLVTHDQILIWYYMQIDMYYM